VDLCEAGGTVYDQFVYDSQDRLVQTDLHLLGGLGILSSTRNCQWPMKSLRGWPTKVPTQT
jgi:hypothetical protein